MSTRKTESRFRNHEYALTARSRQFCPIARRNFDRTACGELFDNRIAHGPKVGEIHIVRCVDRRLELGRCRFKTGLILDEFPCSIDTTGQDCKLPSLLVRESLTPHPGSTDQKP